MHIILIYIENVIWFQNNIYLRSVLQRVDHTVIVIDGYAVNHGVPELFVHLDGLGGGAHYRLRTAIIAEQFISWLEEHRSYDEDWSL